MTDGGLSSRHFHGGVIQTVRYRPGDADHDSPAQILGDRRAADPERSSDVALTWAGSVLET